MVTTVTKSVGTTGRDYSTLALAIAALPASLVTADQAWVFELYNDSEFLVTTQINPTGNTTDATRNITFKCAAGQSFRDNAGVQSNALYYNVSNGVGIRSATPYLNEMFSSNDNYVTLDGLQFSYDKAGVAVAFESGHCTIQNCIVLANAVGGGDFACLRLGKNSGGGDSNSAYNTLCVNTQTGAGGTGSYLVLTSNEGLNKIINCTLVAPNGISGRPAIKTSGGTYQGLNQVVNTAVFGFSTSFTDDTTDFGSSGNNCTDLVGTSVPGSSNQVSKTASNQFVSATNDFRAKTGGDIIDTGQNASATIGSSVDIANTTRPQGSAWDIGCWELVVASAVTAARRLLTLGVG